MWNTLLITFFPKFLILASWYNILLLWKQQHTHKASNLCYSQHLLSQCLPRKKLWRGMYRYFKLILHSWALQHSRRRGGTDLRILVTVAYDVYYVYQYMLVQMLLTCMYMYFIIFCQSFNCKYFCSLFIEGFHVDPLLEPPESYMNGESCSAVHAAFIYSL